MIKVFVNGGTGKMGSETIRAISNEPDLILLGSGNSKDSLSDPLKSLTPEVVVDFTHPSCVKKNAQAILEHGVCAVIGTTGLTATDLEELHQLALKQQKGVLVCPNFAIGAILMMKFAAQAAEFMPRVEIIEYHHDKKADAPSGTALKTADFIYAQNPHINAQKLDEKELIPGARGGAKHRIPIHSVRLPGYLAHQEVILGGLGQTLTIRHDTLSRESFMPGVILCIRKVVALKGLIYGMENVL